MGKPIVFNYAEHEKLKAAYDEQVERNKELLEEIRRLRSKVSDLSIRCRIAEADLMEATKGLIRRESLEKAIMECKRHTVNIDGADTVVLLEVDVMWEIRHAPEADRPTGEWIEIDDYAGGIHYQCDKCKEEFILMYGTPKENGYNYCPACGAKMEEKNEQS